MTTSNLSAVKFAEETLSVHDLEVDPRIQRPMDNKMIKKVQTIVRTFNVNALGVFTVSRRNNGALIVIDGQCRAEAVRRVAADGDHDGKVSCHVFTGLTLSQEAQMFLDLNYGTNPTPLQKFKIRLAAGEPVALDIEKILRYYGWTIGFEPGAGTISAVAAVDRVYALSEKGEFEPNLVQMAILAISRAWGTDKSAAQGAIIEGVARLFAEYSDRVDLDHLVSRMADYVGGPNKLFNNARSLAIVQNWKLAPTVASILVDEYNKGRRLESSKLPVWRARR